MPEPEQELEGLRRSSRLRITPASVPPTASKKAGNRKHTTADEKEEATEEPNPKPKRGRPSKKVASTAEESEPKPKRRRTAAAASISEKATSTRKQPTPKFKRVGPPKKVAVGGGPRVDSGRPSRPVSAVVKTVSKPMTK